MIRFRWAYLVAILSLLIMIAAGCLFFFISRLPSTPQEKFTYETGYAWPADAVLVDSKDDYRQGFKLEGTTAIHIRTTPEKALAWLSGKPPFGEEWKRGADSMVFINTQEKLIEHMRYCAQGGQRAGDSLTIDPATGDAWYYHWQW